MAWPGDGRRRRTSGGSGAPVGDEQLQPHEVEAGDQLGHRVLDLEPGVHLEEGEAPVGQDEELDGAGVHVADGARPRSPRRRPARPRRSGVTTGRRGLLDDLLVAALDRALALEEVHDGAVGVAEDLHLDVAGARDVAARRTRCRRRRRTPPRAGPRPRRRPSSSGPSHHAHAPAAAAGRGLDEHGPAEGRHRRRSTVAGRRRRPRAGSRRWGARARPPPPWWPWPRASSPWPRSPSGGGPTQTSPAATHGPGEGGVLGQEAVAGVDGVGAAAPAPRATSGVDVEVGLGRRGPGQAHGLVGLGDVGGVGVGVGEHGHAADAQRVGGADDAAGDLAPVGDEELAGSPASRPRSRSHPEHAVAARAVDGVCCAMTERHMPSTVRVSRGSMMPSS